MKIIENLKEFYNKNFLIIEFFFSVIITFIIFKVDKFYNFNLIEKMNQNFSVVTCTVASLAGSLIGFIITALTIIISFLALRRFKILKESKQHFVIFNVYKQTIFCLTATTIWSLFILITDNKLFNAQYSPYVTIGLIFLCVFRLYRCVWILNKMTILATIENS